MRETIMATMWGDKYTDQQGNEYEAVRDDRMADLTLNLRRVRKMGEKPAEPAGFKYKHPKRLADEHGQAYTVGNRSVFKYGADGTDSWEGQLTMEPKFVPGYYRYVPDAVLPMTEPHNRAQWYDDADPNIDRPFSLPGKYVRVNVTDA